MRQHLGGTATLQAIALALLFALVLGAFGPALDNGRTYSSYGYTPDQAGEHRRLELDARDRCADDARGDNAGVLILADGAIVCTDNRARSGGSVITIATRVSTP